MFHPNPHSFENNSASALSSSDIKLTVLFEYVPGAFASPERTREKKCFHIIIRYYSALVEEVGNPVVIHRVGVRIVLQSGNCSRRDIFHILLMPSLLFDPASCCPSVQLCNLNFGFSLHEHRIRLGFRNSSYLMRFEDSTGRIRDFLYQGTRRFGYFRQINQRHLSVLKEQCHPTCKAHLSAAKIRGRSRH